VKKYGVRNCRLLTMAEGYPVHDDGAMTWDDDGTVIAAGPAADVVVDGDDVAWRDMLGRLVMPGLICTHGHFYGFLARGISLKDAPPENFPQILERLWWRLDKALDLESVECSALVGLVDCLRGGTTTFIDHHASPSAVDGSLDAVARAAQTVGMRVCTCYEVSDRDGTEIRDRGLAENVRFLQKYAPGSHGTLSAAFGLHASFTVDTETLEKVAEMLPAGAGIHIHCCEDIADVTESERKYGARPVERLDKAGLLDGNALLAHGVHLNEAEMELLADRGCRLLHNPMSNMNNAVGVAPVIKFIEKGILVGLGSDGYSSTMFDEYATAAILHKLDARDPRKAFVEPFDMLFKNNAAIASPFFKKPVGVLEPGACADFLVMDYEPPTPMDSGNLIGHMCFGLSRVRPREVVIGGRTVLQKGEFANLDPKDVAVRAREATKGLWERF